MSNFKVGTVVVMTQRAKKKWPYGPNLGALGIIIPPFNNVITYNNLVLFYDSFKHGHTGNYPRDKYPYKHSNCYWIEPALLDPYIESRIEECM